MLSMEMNCLPFFFRTDENLYHMFLLRFKRIADFKKKSSVIRDKALRKDESLLLFCLKGDNFNVK